MASIVCRAWWLGFHIKLSAWVLRCSFYCAGQCESLKVWNVRQVRISTLFLCMPASSELISTNAETGRSIGKQNSNAMQTNYLKCLCLILLILAAGTTDAQNFEVNGIYYNVLSEDNDGGTVEVTYKDGMYGGYAGDIVIPAEVSHDGGTYRVTTIGDYAFSNCGALTSVSMPEITRIGDGAFYSCSALTSISMPSVTAIGREAFWDCYSLSSVSIPSTVTTIGERVFDGCDSLKEITVDEANADYASVDGVLYDKEISTLLCCPGAKTSVSIPNSVTTIGDYAFYGCSLLESIEMNSVITIGDFAITYCNALTSVNIPSTTTTIGEAAFVGCNSLKEIIVDEANSHYASVDGILYDKEVTTLLCCPGAKSVVKVPNSVMTVAYGAFAESQSLTSVSMPSVTTIGESAFEYCTSLESVEMPSAITISDYAFFECTHLLSADMPSVETIGIQAFSDCESMPLIDIPSTTKSIDKYAFDACDLLRKIYCHWDEPLECDDLFNDYTCSLATLYVPTGTIEAYSRVYPWSKFLNIEEKDYSGIADATASEMTVKVIDGAIIIEGGDGTVSMPTVEVYSAGGQCVYRGTDSSIGGLGHGIYVVKVGGMVQKVAL